MISIVALFVAISGTAIALPGRNTVNSGDIINREVKNQDLNGDAVASGKIENGQVRSVDIRNDGVKGADVDESTVSGLIRSGATIPSGVTVSGNFVARDSDSGQSHLVQEAVSFPLPAPEALTASDVNFAPGAVVGSDDDSDCTGSIANPTAPPDKVCLYEGGGANATTAQGYVSGAGFVNNRLGFEILVNGNGDVALSGAWAYTAP
ncbi:MAG TPA: hypothetical protein VLA62_00415 [Solirubrobacterales bacterium]|nr:hypothetical protein [Solirubrobacterales bacterium]